MDKINTALCGVEDNAERIKRLEREISALKSASAATVRNGEIASGETRFGAVTGRAAIVAFTGGGSRSLRIEGVEIGAGASPIVAGISAGGELALAPQAESAIAVIIS